MNEIAREPASVAASCQVFLSYTSIDREAARGLRDQLQRQGLTVFLDVESIRAGDRWLDELDHQLRNCRSFVVLVGGEGVTRWVAGETQFALKRHFDARDLSSRLEIFPVLLNGTPPETLPALLQVCQATDWNGSDALSGSLLQGISEGRSVVSDAIQYVGCPFVGLAAFSPKEERLFFGRQKETLDALACFFDRRPGSDAVRWLEINGSSGAGKSSLMSAGLLPLIESGWLWRPGVRFEQWRRIGPMMPGKRPVEMLAETLARAFGQEMADVRPRLERDERGLAEWLRSRKSPDGDLAFLLAIDQFEELFTFADPEERKRFDGLVAAALEDPECPLFLITTVRTDFLDRFAENLPCLVGARNRLMRTWTLTPIMGDSLAEVIDGPARLAGLDVTEVKHAMIDQARNEPGALPLVENALYWLWQKRVGNRLSGGEFSAQCGLAGILSQGADDLLSSLGEPRRELALELLFQLVEVDPDAGRHTRQRMPYAKAVALAGGDADGGALLDQLAGQRSRDGSGKEGPLRLVTITEEAEGGAAIGDRGRWVNLIHETLIRSKGRDASGEPQPFWPTLWKYLERHKERAAWRKRLQADMREWHAKGRKDAFRWSNERVREAERALRWPERKLDLSDDEQQFLGPIDPEAMQAELERPGTDHRRRLLIGERLAVLGDPREGVGVLDGKPQVAWCEVKAGETTVEIRADPNFPVSSKVVKGVPREVPAFRIARYPVTVAQYRAFLAAKDGWCDKDWWGEDLYRDPKGDMYPFGEFGNHPAVYVSWFDAMAFCRWLSRRLELSISLPDEWQWQRAALEDRDDGDYPWGSAWEPQGANTFESGLFRATAVGMYPAGAASCGARDMAGTVWEWCLNKLDPPETTESKDDDFDPRVLRGGSWGGNPDNARAAVRVRNNPNNRNFNFGFRVACSSPSSGH